MKPRIGCIGLGWIGRSRLQALVESGEADVTMLWDDDPAAMAAAADVAPGARPAESLDALLDATLDGVMIATPSAIHAEQTARALDRRLAVFCQKPLARNRAEAEQLVTLARRCDRLLQVDLSYRYARAFETLRQFVAEGGVGTPHALELTFHNAYGPDKPWYYSPELSGGGCVMDLGTHLVDQVLRTLGLGGGSTPPRVIASHLFSNGSRWERAAEQVEDLAYVQLEAPMGAVVRIACSWRLPAGCDAVIGATVYGPRAGVRVRNVAGSFYDFVAERLDRGGIEHLVGPPDAWGGRAAVEWAKQLGKDAGYDPACEGLIVLSKVIDDIYETATQGASRALSTATPSLRRVFRQGL